MGSFERIRTLTLINGRVAPALLAGLAAPDSSGRWAFPQLARLVFVETYCMEDVELSLFADLLRARRRAFAEGLVRARLEIAAQFEGEGIMPGRPMSDAHARAAAEKAAQVNAWSASLA